MHIFNLVVLSVFIFISGCTTFNSIEVVEPSVGFRPTEVKSLQPLLSWEKLDGYDGSYDLIVMSLGEREAWYKRAPMNIIYWKRDIYSLEHKIEELLKSDSYYHWSVRPSTSKDDDDWARYNYYFFGGIIFFSVTNSYFIFKTPELSPLAINQD